MTASDKTTPDVPATPSTFNSMYRQFKTDSDLEAQGVEIDYGSFVVTIARAGGANKTFARVLEAKTKPHRRAIATDMMDPERAAQILRETYAASVILNWQTRVDGALKVGIEPVEGGKLLPFTPANVILTLVNLPDLFADLQEQAGRVALFRESLLEGDAGN